MIRNLLKLDRQLLSREIFTNPYPIYKRLRTEDPVHWSDAWGCWVLTCYDDVRSCLRDYRRFSNAGRIALFLDQLPGSVQHEVGALYENWSVGMPNTDPPSHTRVRSLVSKAFTPKVVENIRPRVQEIADDLLNVVEDAGRMDVVRDIAFHLPSIIIADLLGVPQGDRDKFKAWANDIVAFHGTGRPKTNVVRRSLKALIEMREWLRGLIDQRRHQPRNDLLSALVAAEEHGNMLNEVELVATCITLLTAGHETTTGLIGNGVLALLRHPEQLQKLKDDLTLVPSAVNEFLRYDTSFQKQSRQTTEDVQIRGKIIRRGQIVSLMLGAANRDPSQFPDPDWLDVTRHPNRHLAFGHGLHSCIGEILGRCEAEIVVASLIDRFPKLRLAEDGIVWNENNTFHSLKSLPVLFY